MNRTRFTESISGGFPRLERRIYTCLFCLCQRTRTRLHSKVVYCWLYEMHELQIERSVNTHGLLRVSVKSLPNEMQHTIRKLYSTDRKGPLTIRTNRTNSNSTLRTARALNDPYESNELNLPLADCYSAGVLDMSG